MAAKDTVRCNKTVIQTILRADHRLILNMVDEKGLLTRREYNNLKSMKVDDEGLINELLDKIMDKGDDTCRAFLDLLQTDEEIKNTFPDLKKIRWTNTSLLPTPIQSSSAEHGDGPSQEKWKQKQYQLNSQPTGLCVIINNENFRDSVFWKQRRGTDQDAQSLAEVFSWLGFRVLMCKDQPSDQMDQALKCFASLSDLSQLHEFNVKEWSGTEFTDIKEAPPSLKHGDAFICCILSHGERGVVKGIDGKSLPIKHITRTFNATDQSALTNKPKVFLIQACQGEQAHLGVLSADLEADDSQSLYIPEEADFLVAIATVEAYKSFRHIEDGSWFIQSVCQQLKEGCSRGDDMMTILSCVNNEVSKKEAVKEQPGKVKQMSEVRFTLRKRLVLTPRHY